jgi:hypothetical protein
MPHYAETNFSICAVTNWITAARAREMNNALSDIALVPVRDASTPLVD